VRAEAHDRHDCQQHQRTYGARGHPDALAPARRRQHHERKHEPGRCLHADADHEHGCGCPEIALPISSASCAGSTGGRPIQHSLARLRLPRARRERKRCRQDEQYERVVVGASRIELQQDRIQAYEHGRRPPRAAHPARCLRGQRDRAQARGHRDRLERPQSARQSKWGQGVGAECEQGSIGRVLKGPADEREHSVVGGFRRHVGVGVKSMQDPQAREREIAEHILGDEWRTHQQQHVRGRDREGDGLAGQYLCSEQHDHVARAHRQRERLKARGPDPEPKWVQRSRQPAGPATASGRHIGGGCSGGARAYAEYACRHDHQPRHSKHAQRHGEPLDEARRRATVRRGRYAFRVAVL
jgi:hypothetical protein